MSSKCKMVCTEVKEQSDKVFSYKFMAVHEGSEENKEFFKWTPSGNLDLQCTNDQSFEVGKEYFVNISEA